MTGGIGVDVADERGVVTASVAILAVGLLFMAGLVYDGGQAIATYRRAGDLAANAARAAAQGVDEAALRSGTTHIDGAAARARAAAFLDEAGYPGTGSVTVEGDQVTVTVTLTHEPFILPIPTRRVRASASATAARGVDQSPIGGP